MTTPDHADQNQKAFMTKDEVERLQVEAKTASQNAQAAKKEYRKTKKTTTKTSTTRTTSKNQYRELQR